MWASILCKIEVDEYAGKTYCVQKYNSLKNVCALRLESNVSLNLCFSLSFMKHVSSLVVEAFGCYIVLTTLPLNI